MQAVWQKKCPSNPTESNLLRKANKQPRPSELSPADVPSWRWWTRSKPLIRCLGWQGSQPNKTRFEQGTVTGIETGQTARSGSEQPPMVIILALPYLSQGLRSLLILHTTTTQRSPSRDICRQVTAVAHTSLAQAGKWSTSGPRNRDRRLALVMKVPYSTQPITRPVLALRPWIGPWPLPQPPVNEALL